MTTEQKPALEVVAWSKASKAHIPSMRMLNESYLKGVWDVPLVRLADHEVACEALRKDAARYKWIRDRKGDIVAEQYRDGWATCLPGKALDAAIDAALLAGKGDAP